MVTELMWCLGDVKEKVKKDIAEGRERNSK